MVGNSIDKTLPTRPSTPSEVADELHPVPKTFAGRYRIGAVIGTGGFGVVYTAIDEHLEKTVAVKVLRGGRTRDAKAMERFRTEALTTGQLNHPNIVAVTDFGVLDDGRPYLVMEYIDGESLSDVLRRDRMLPIEEAARIARSLCSALTAAHERGVIHRDLKPDNVIMQGDEDEPRVVKIVDFGIAKLTQSDVVTDSTETSGLIGTPTYMAPEQIRGKENLDGRADVYALGVILFKMLTGKTPFAGRPPGDLMIAKATEKPPRLRAFNEDIPATLEKVVLRAIQADPAARTATAAKLSDELLPFTNEHVVVRRAPRWLLPAVIAALVVGGALTYGFTRSRGGDKAKQIPATNPGVLRDGLTPAMRTPPSVTPHAKGGETATPADTGAAVEPAAPGPSADPGTTPPTNSPESRVAEPPPSDTKPPPSDTKPPPTGRESRRPKPKKPQSPKRPANKPKKGKGDLLYGD